MNRKKENPMQPNHSIITKKLSAFIFLTLLVLPVIGQTEEQQKHPKFQELVEHYNTFNAAKQKGDYTTALTEAQKALELAKEIFGEEDTTTATVYNNLGEAYKDKREYDKAIEMYEKSLKIRIKKFGEEHTDTAKSYNNLGNIYHSKGEHDKAIDYFNKSLEINIKALGAYHLDTAMSYNNLGGTYNSKGDYDKAIEYYNKSVNILLITYGGEHPNTGICFHNIGLAFIEKKEYDKAIENFKAALDIYSTISVEKHRSKILRICNDIGRTYEMKGDNVKAKEWFDKALQSKDKKNNLSEDPKYVKLTEHLKGYETAKQKGDYSIAIIEVGKALELAREIFGEENKIISVLYNNLGSAYYDNGEYDKAIEFYETYLKRNQKILGEEHSDIALSYDNLGLAYSGKGEYERAIEFHYKSLAILLKNLGEDNLSTAINYDNLGLAYSNKGELDKAVEFHAKANKVFLKLLGENHVDTAISYNNLGRVYLDKGEYGKSFEFYAKSLAIRIKMLGEHHPVTAIAYSNLGSVYKHKGETDKALEYYSIALKINIETLGEIHPNTAKNYNNLGTVYNDLGMHDKAIDFHTHALGILLKILTEGHPDIAMSYNLLGSTYASKSQYDKALEYFHKSLSIYLKILGENHPSTATAYNNLGSGYYHKGDYDNAIIHSKKAIVILEKFLDRFQHVNSVHNLSKAYKAQKNIPKQIETLNQTVDLVLKYRQAMGKDKDYFTQKFIPVFEELIQIYNEQSEYEKAFEISEKMRGLSMMEEMNLKFALKEIKAPKEKVDGFLNLRGQMQGLDSQRVAALSKGEAGKVQVATISKKIMEIQSQLDSIEKEFSKNPEYTKLRRFTPPSTKDIQKKLKATNQTFLEYNLIHKDGNEELHVTVITSGEFKHLTLGTNVDLKRKVNNLRKIISEYPDSRKFILVKSLDKKDIICSYSECKGFEEGREFIVKELDFKNSFKEDGKLKYIDKLVGTQERKIDVEDANRIMDSLLKELYTITIKPIEKAGLLKSKSIVISPDSTLFTVPFSALKNAEGKYAIEEYEISLIHSASIWERLVRKEAIKFDKPFFAMGHSVYGIGHNDTRGVKGKRGLRSMEKDLRSLKDISDIDSMRMNNLPGSLEEIKEISKMVYGKEEPEHIFLGIRANKDELYKAFTKTSSDKDGVRSNTYKSVHFSVHGLFFLDSPELNSLAFTSRERAANFREEDLKEYERKNGELKKDGYFKLGETIELGIKTDLIVMSACETSLGTEKPGEGMVGLPQGFLMGGANNVLATLWSVDDKGTMNFMKEFYSPYFKKNLSPANALRNAQKVLSAKASKEDKYKDPFYWSPFVVYGK